MYIQFLSLSSFKTAHLPLIFRIAVYIIIPWLNKYTEFTEKELSLNHKL